jgi:hypothetical protein
VVKEEMEVRQVMMAVMGLLLAARVVGLATEIALEEMVPMVR